MEIFVRDITTAGDDVEIVERKGLGHPDTICDALAEQLSVALSRFYLENFDVILHHNVDKVLLWGGSSQAAFGGGEVTKPIEVFIAGRATQSFKGKTVPVEALAVEACRNWFGEHFHALDPAAHVKIHCLIRPGSADLVDLYLRQKQTGMWLANDTSCGVGFAPLTELEHMVLEVEKHLNAPATKTSYPQIGQDVKVMGIRSRRRINLTLACALIGRYLRDLYAYLDSKILVAGLARKVAERGADQQVSAVVNAADDPDRGNVYLTVTGTSAEAGDDGQAGRGNRANGLITPYRPMTMESASGKNPISHVGKLYNVVAALIARALVEEQAHILEAHCVLVSRIGQPVGEPQIVDVLVRTRENRPVDEVAVHVREIVRAELEGINTLWRKVIQGEVSLY